MREVIMFCPECKAEYLDGVTTCAGCGVPLVAVLPPEPDHSGEGFVHVLSTYNAGDVAVVQSILEGTDIEYFIKGKNFNEMEPLVQPAQLYVARHQVNTVKELLDDVKIRFLGVTQAEE
jgi:hypothetical protein